MLIHINISNLVTIKQLELDFSRGTTVITGETGAGKSILIDSIELALGGRASSGWVRPGFEKADITLTFDVERLPRAKTWLTHYDLLDTTNTCILRRVIYEDGRSRCFINGMPTTLQPLRELSELLIEIHGQHEHLTLLKSETQRYLLDHYTGILPLVDKVADIAEEWLKIQRELEGLQTQTKERFLRKEFLNFQLTELLELNLTPDEFQNLDREHKQLTNAEEILQTLSNTLENLADDEEFNISKKMNYTIQALENIQAFHVKIPSWVENLKNAFILLSDTEDELRRYLETVELNPERLREVETRLRILFDVARKYKISPNELYELQLKVSQELAALEGSDARIEQLTMALSQLEKNYVTVANELSHERQLGSKKLALEINHILHALSLPNAEFEIQLERQASETLSAYGLETVGFMIKTNSGQSLQSLSKIVSGGELSRVGLAVAIATAKEQTTPTLIFDEVDVGIGGGTAEIVGQLLRNLGEHHQVLCITHQPQVAARGQQHFCVVKIEENNETHTVIKALSIGDRIKEVARMLGGVEITQKTLAHAQELVGGQ